MRCKEVAQSRAKGEMDDEHLVWQSLLKKGGSMMTQSMVPLSSAVQISQLVWIASFAFLDKTAVITWELEGLLVVIKDILGEDVEAIVVLKQHQLRPVFDGLLSLIPRTRPSKSATNLILVKSS